MKGFIRRRPTKKMAVTITFVIGLSLLLGVVFVNLYKVSNFKMLTANIVGKGTLGMCSALGSHANLMIETLNSRGGLGFWPFNAPNCDSNWAQILPLSGLLLSIVLGILGGVFGWSLVLIPAVAAFALGSWSLVATMSEVHAIMKRAGPTVAKEMVDYNGIREMSIQSMLSQIQTDPVNVKRQNAASAVFTDPNGNIYDLTGSSVLPAITGRMQIPRFTAWYYSNRFPQVSDRTLLNQIDAFITFLTQITRIERWDNHWMMIREISLRVDGLSGVITDPSAAWVIDMNSVRALGPVKADGRLEYTQLINMLVKNQNQGFLPTKFIELTNRLLDAKYPIKYSTKNPWGLIPIIGQTHGYDHSQIWHVVEDLRGFLIRTMEILNMPVSERLPTISKWLPAFYNPSAKHADLNDGQDMWEIINRTLNIINDWIQQLQAVDALMRNEAGLNNTAGFIEVSQAIRILQRLVTTLQSIPPAIETLNAALNQNTSPTDTKIIALKNEAVYGWSSRNWDDVGNPNFQDTYHLVNVRLDRYPPFSQFPNIVQIQHLGGLLKCWRMLGNTSGDIDFSVSRYDSDLPSVWWNSRFRKRSGAVQFPVSTLSKIINEIHQNNSQVTSYSNANVSALLTYYAINSITRGYYAPKKSLIKIERMR